MTQSELEALCAKWQRILRLQDWRITVRLVRRYEMHTHDILGESAWSLENKTATIHVLDPIDCRPGKEGHVEATLIHELIHLHLAPFRPREGSVEETLMEQAIACIEDALITLARGGGAPDTRPTEEMAAEPSGIEVAGASDGKVASLDQWRAQRVSRPRTRKTA